MSKNLIVLSRLDDRKRAHEYVEAAPAGTRVEFKAPRRTLPQNDRFWAMLTDIARQKEHCGRKYPTTIWKVLMMHAMGREAEFLPALNGEDLVSLGYHSSELSKDEMSELMEFMSAWGAEHSVEFHEPVIGSAV